MDTDAKNFNIIARSHNYWGRKPLTGLHEALEDVKKGDVVLGSPAFPIGEFRRCHAVFKTLPELRNIVFELQREVAKLKHES